MQLIIGNKNYSSWSLRGWLMLKGFDLAFDEIRLPLFTDTFAQEIGRYTDTKKVPVLIDGDIRVWDSLAICEYINEAYLKGAGWPSDIAERSLARAISCEMHSGFVDLRHEMPMNCRAKGEVNASDKALADIQRINQIWTDLRTRYSEQGPWLFGQFSIADVVYAPVALRFASYGPTISEQASAYVQTILGHPAIQEWIAAAKVELEVIPEEEVLTEK
ncbi:glutathione S-transferase [Oceanospirillum multiglobuliferum]|uniref:Glutathione S-transferase n=1 Tax=Oceanospirillum multiglobuliferum TaxID=64969 RepID=A0A1T4SCM6_9GAMM|nr:glutathione S-transferase family protein [Oceanospirillum multiglobuliferum]OPX55051.1 glutathione S-transferase [Oceanospirillum multiglobuliferum]SKA25907.1 glutathione S-transferase [Oceanospirillum multiglobuliferum]